MSPAPNSAARRKARSQATRKARKKVQHTSKKQSPLGSPQHPVPNTQQHHPKVVSTRVKLTGPHETTRRLMAQHGYGKPHLETLAALPTTMAEARAQMAEITKEDAMIRALTGVPSRQQVDSVRNNHGPKFFEAFKEIVEENPQIYKYRAALPPVMTLPGELDKMANHPIRIPQATRKKLTELALHIKRDPTITDKNDRTFLVTRVKELTSGKNVKVFFDRAPVGGGVFNYYRMFGEDYDRKAALTARHLALKELVSTRTSNEPLDPAEMASVYSLTTNLDPALAEHRKGLPQLNKGLTKAWQRLRQKEAAQQAVAEQKAAKRVRAREKRLAPTLQEKAVQEAEEETRIEAEAATRLIEEEAIREATRQARVKTMGVERQKVRDEKRPALIKALTPGSRGYADLRRFQQATQHLPAWTDNGKNGEPSSMDKLTDLHWAKLATKADMEGIPVPKVIEHYIKGKKPAKPPEKP